MQTPRGEVVRDDRRDGRRGGQGPDSPVSQALLRALELCPKDSGKVKKFKPRSEIIIVHIGGYVENELKSIKNGYGSTQKK